MDVQRIEGIADLVGEAASQEGQRMDPFGLDRLGGGLPGFGGITENQDESGTPGCGTIERSDVQSDQPGPRIFHFELGAEHPVATGLIEGGDMGPVQIGQVARDQLLFGGLRRNAQHAGGHEVDVHHAPLVVGDDDARVDGVEETLEELPLLGQPLHDALKTAGIEASEMPQGLVEEAGFDPIAPIQSHRFCRK
jgi:hypothetical protein